MTSWHRDYTYPALAARRKGDKKKVLKLFIQLTDLHSEVLTRVYKNWNSFSGELVLVCIWIWGCVCVKWSDRTTGIHFTKGILLQSPQLWKPINNTSTWKQDLLQISKFSVNVLQFQLEVWSPLQNVCDHISWLIISLMLINADYKSNTFA